MLPDQNEKRRNPNGFPLVAERNPASPTGPLASAGYIIVPVTPVTL